MPSRSPAQVRLMAAVAHGWKPPVGSGINVPMKVAQDFNQADAGTGVRQGADFVAGVRQRSPSEILADKLRKR